MKMILDLNANELNAIKLENPNEYVHLPEHNVMPTKIDTIHAVYPLPSLKSLKNWTYSIPNEYVIPSAKIEVKEETKILWLLFMYFAVTGKSKKLKS